MWQEQNLALVPLPVLIGFIKALFVVRRFQERTVYDPNDPDTFVVGLQKATVQKQKHW